jgi:hypothetical protein
MSKRRPVVDETWARIGGKERVRIGRIWTICACDSPTMHGYRPEHWAGSVDAVRCHPRHGGPSWWTVMPEFLKRYECVADESETKEN